MVDEGDAVAVKHSMSVRCEAYPEDCRFAMQAGVFDGGPSPATLLPGLPSGTCPTCGADLEEWDPLFEGAAPGRPAEW